MKNKLLMTSAKIDPKSSPANPKTRPCGGILQRIERINSFRPENFVPFLVAGQAVGRVRRDIVKTLSQWPDVFVRAAEGIHLAASLDNYENRTRALEAVVATLEAQGAFSFPPMREPYPVKGGWGEEPLFEIERNATILFGVPVFGVHVNGYHYENKDLKIWLQLRSKTLRAWPGVYDQMAAGGQPVGISVYENTIKELGEEALLPRAIAERVVPVGTVSYAQEMREGVRIDTLFIWDLELPAGVVPRPDGVEVESFTCFDSGNLLDRINDPEDAAFKPNAALVLADFFIRHGRIGPDSDPDYAAILGRLRRF